MKKVMYVKFLNEYGFVPEYTLKISIEREYFIGDRDGNIKASGPKLVKWINDPDQYDTDLPACQLESRIILADINNVEQKLWGQERALRDFGVKYSFTRIFDEVGPEDIPLDVTPKKRYLDIAKDLTDDELRSGCRVIGTHVHIGMPDFETALVVYNHVIQYLDELCEMGDGSNGERLRLYKEMAPNYMPPKYDSLRDFYSTAVEQGFAKDPTKCWHLIRIHPNGTIEFRMFGSTQNVGKVASWAKRCHEICLEALRQDKVNLVNMPLTGFVNY